MVFNYVPSGYHGSSISSVWQCNSLCPAAMSAKLRQFTCSCSYIALRKNDLPSILCIHLISGTHSLTPPTWAVTGKTKSKGKVCLFFLSVQHMATKYQYFWLTHTYWTKILHSYVEQQSSVYTEWIWGMGTEMYQLPDIIQPRYAERNLV